MNAEKISEDIYGMAKDIYVELGGGFNESVLQNALAIELREKRVNYLEEVNIEIFYKGQSIGTDRSDSVPLPSRRKAWDLTEPVVLETKVSAKINDDNRQQLKSYFKSFPHNKNSTLHGIKKGILINFLKTEELTAEEKTKPEIELEFWVYDKSRRTMKLKYRLPENEKD